MIFFSLMSGLFLSLDIFSFFFNNIFLGMFFFFIIFFFKKKIFFFLMFFFQNLENSMPLNEKINNKKIIIFFFFLIFFFNFLSLFPHIFSIFSLFNFTLLMSFSLWLSSFLLNYFFFLKKFLTHLTPISTPLILMSFMVLIELISQMIRPLTLLIRLGVNLTTGHLILGLMSFFSIFSFFFQIPFFLLEILVAMVQSYVFSLLLILYFNE